MANIIDKHGFKAYVLSSDDESVVASFIPERGGIMDSLMVAGRELLYRHPEFWDPELEDLPGAWPFCFPICARLSYRGFLGAYKLGDKIYEMPIHGLAWWAEWQVVGQGDNWIELLFADNNKTHELYPFKFNVLLRYELYNDKLICKQTYKNLSDYDMPYYAGFHPYFLTPELNDKEKVILDYNPIARYIYNEDYTDIVGETDIFELPASVTNPELNEQLTKLGADKTAGLMFPDGFNLSINVVGNEDTNMFSYLQLYTMPDKPFFCVEPWMAPPNSINTGGARWLAAQQQEQACLSLSFVG